MKSLTPEQIEAKNTLDGEAPWLILYEVWLDALGSERYCFVYHDQPVTYGRLTYRPFPVVRGTVTESVEGDLSQWPVTVGIATEIAASLEEHHGFLGLPVRMLLVHKDSLDNPFPADEAVAYVQACEMTEESVNLTLGYDDFFGEEVAHEVFNGRCPFKYKDPDTCAYTGALTSCDHSLTGGNGCVAHGADSSIHPRRFGGFPSIPRGG